ncbi:MAG: hypothetical protein ACI86X_001851 [Moritella sp.]|jgi:hypothetical protein
MASEYIRVDLTQDEKDAVLKHAKFVLTDDVTKTDLENKRKKWIRFISFEMTQVIGELTYHFNRTTSDYEHYFVDQLICHLEFYEKRA